LFIATIAVIQEMILFKPIKFLTVKCLHWLMIENRNRNESYGFFGHAEWVNVIEH